MGNIMKKIMIERKRDQDGEQNEKYYDREEEGPEWGTE